MLKQFRINNQIRAAQVTVIGNDGAQLGTMTVPEALALAKDKELDLVEVGPTAQPPIVKIMDYGKFMYQKERQEKKSGARPKNQEQKTVRVGFKTGVHDLNFKAKQINGFLGEGHNVKVELTLRGREKGLAGMGRDKLIAFLATLTEPYIQAGPIIKSPYGWVAILHKDKKIKK